ASPRPTPGGTERVPRAGGGAFSRGGGGEAGGLGGVAVATGAPFARFDAAHAGSARTRATSTRTACAFIAGSRSCESVAPRRSASRRSVTRRGRAGLVGDGRRRRPARDRWIGDLTQPGDQLDPLVCRQRGSEHAGGMRATAASSAATRATATAGRTERDVDVVARALLRERDLRPGNAREADDPQRPVDALQREQLA